MMTSGVETGALRTMRSWCKARGGAAILSLGLGLAGPAFAEEQAKGLLHIPQYAGALSERSHLTGDWGGRRTEWAKKGLQVDVDSVTWADTVVDGGKTDDTEIGGTIQYNVKWDLMRAGILPGALIQLRADSRFGDSAMLNTGQITINNFAALSPTNYSDFDGGYDLALSQLSYLQMFSEHFGVIVGKLDMYGEGDTNEFAGGRGRTQFMNWNLNVTTPALIVPAASVGGGVVVLPNENLSITSLLVNNVECTNSDCFDVLGDNGFVSVNTASYQYSLGGLPGGLNGSLFYFFDADFSDIDSIGIYPNDGVVGLVGNDKSSSWQGSISFWQYVSIDGEHEGPVDLTNKVPDLRGWGVFGRLSLADPDTNPWRTTVALGVGGRGVVPGRPNDLFGIGGFYNDLEQGRITQRAEFDDDYVGMEAFYNFAITPAARLSANLQILPSVPSTIDDSVLFSARLHMVF
jgi:porin